MANCGCAKKTKTTVAGVLGIIQSAFGLALNISILLKLISDEKDDEAIRYIKMVSAEYENAPKSLTIVALVYNLVWFMASIGMLVGSLMKYAHAVGLWVIITAVSVLLDIILTGFFFAVTIEKVIAADLPDQASSTSAPITSQMHTWYVLLCFGLCRLGPITIITNILLCFLVFGRISELLKMKETKAPFQSQPSNEIELQTNLPNGRTKNYQQEEAAEEDFYRPMTQNPLYAEELTRGVRGRPLPEPEPSPTYPEVHRQSNQEIRRENQPKRLSQEQAIDRRNQEPVRDRRSNQLPQEAPRDRRNLQEPVRERRPDRMPEEPQRSRKNIQEPVKYNRSQLLAPEAPRDRIPKRIPEDPPQQYLEPEPGMFGRLPEPIRIQRPIVRPLEHQPSVNRQYEDQRQPEVLQVPQDRYPQYPAHTSEASKPIKNSHLYVPTPFVTPPIDYDRDDSFERGYDNPGLELTHDDRARSGLRRTGSGYSNNGRPSRVLGQARSSRLEDIKQNGLRRTGSAASNFDRSPIRSRRLNQNETNFDSGLQVPRNDAPKRTTPNVSRNNSLRSQQGYQSYDQGQRSSDQRGPSARSQQDYSASRNSSLRSLEPSTRQAMGDRRYSPGASRLPDQNNDDRRRARRPADPRQIAEDSSEEEMRQYNQPHTNNRY